MNKNVRLAIAIIWTILIFFMLVSFTPKQTKSIKLELSVDEINLVLEALGEMPAKKSNVLINKIILTSNEQLKAK